MASESTPADRMSRPCIGYGEREGACPNWSTVAPFLWCPTCEAVRRDTISGQMASVTAGFDETSGEGEPSEALRALKDLNEAICPLDGSMPDMGEVIAVAQATWPVLRAAIDFPARSTERAGAEESRARGLLYAKQDAALAEARAEVERLRGALDEVEALAGNPGYNAVFDLAGDISAAVVTGRAGTREGIERMRGIAAEVGELNRRIHGERTERRDDQQEGTNARHGPNAGLRSFGR